MTKRVLISLIVVLVLVGLVACGSVEPIEQIVEDAVVTEPENVSTDDMDAKPQADEQILTWPVDNSGLSAFDFVKDMRIGWNLGNTMDVINSGIGILRNSPPYLWETGWGNPVTTPELFDVLYENGFNVFRIPVSWNDHLMINEDYKIVDSWMDRVQEIVDYAYQTGAYVIINTHHEHWLKPYYGQQEHVSYILRRIWEQIAERFKDYSDRLIFEGMNEPRKVGTAVEWTGGDREGWEVINHLNKVFIQTVRNSGGNNLTRYLMITPHAANGWEAAKHLEVPENDNRIIVSVHAYEPYEFALKVDGRGNWINETGPIDRLMNGLYERFVSKGIPVIMGEFGAMFKPAEGNEADRGEWAEYYIRKAMESGIPCIWWDNGGFTGNGELFGLINRQTNEFVYPLVVEGLFRGLSQ